MNPAQVIGLALMAVGAFIFGTGIAEKKEPAHTPSVPNDPANPADPPKE